MLRRIPYRSRSLLTHLAPTAALDNIIGELRLEKGSEHPRWARFELGEVIGPNNRFVPLRILGSGTSANTWLARDEQEDKFVAIKALHSLATKFVDEGLLDELYALRRLQEDEECPIPPHCLKLLSSFRVKCKAGSGEHLCLVTPLFGGDVQALYQSQREPFPLPLTKRILLHTLRGLAHAHTFTMIHADLEADNISFDTGMSDSEIEQWLKSDVLRQDLPKASYGGAVQAKRSQTLPVPSTEEAIKRTYVLGDFGSVLSIFAPTLRVIQPPAWRAAEVYLGGPWNPEADIWSIGCLVFQFVAHRDLFSYTDNSPLNRWGLDKTEYMLYQMMNYACELFPPRTVTSTSNGAEYLTADGTLKKNPTLAFTPYEDLLKHYNPTLSEEDIVSTANFIRRCLQLYPFWRSQANELVKDPWFEGID